MKVKKRVGKPLYECGFSKGLSQSLESAIVRIGYKSQSSNHLKPNELASSMARNIADCLLAVKVLSMSGKPIAQMKAKYWLEVSRYFGEDELIRLEENPKQFVSEFSLNPCQKDRSQTSFLCYMLEKTEHNMAGFWLSDKMMQSMKPAFHKFRSLTQKEIDGRIVSKSPFEVLPMKFIEGLA